jgi:hypothetical protein
MQTVTISYLIAGTIDEQTWTAERILTQHFPDGRARITLMRNGHATQYITYRRAERIHRIVVQEEA